MTEARPGATLSGLRAFAESEGVRLHEMPSGDGVAVVVPDWGGRVIFMGTGEANRLWTHPTLRTEGDWAWNWGGARSWYSPEGGPRGAYFSPDWTEWSCPSAMDPGQYRAMPDADATQIRMANDFQLTTNDGTVFELSLWREVFAAEATEGAETRRLPLRFIHSYRNLGERLIDKEIDLWHLVQIPPGGTILAPLKEGSGEPCRNYFEPIPADRMAVRGNCLSVKIDGALRYKLGVSGRRSAGAVAYFRAEGGEASMLVKRFEVYPEGVYADRPQAAQDTNGDPVQLYNHMTADANAFGEIECHSPAVPLGPKEVQSFEITLTLIEGPRDAVLREGCGLMGVDPAEAEPFDE